MANSSDDESKDDAVVVTTVIKKRKKTNKSAATKKPGKTSRRKTRKTSSKPKKRIAKKAKVVVPVTSARTGSLTGSSLVASSDLKTNDQVQDLDTLLANTSSDPVDPPPPVAPPVAAPAPVAAPVAPPAPVAAPPVAAVPPPPKTDGQIREEQDKELDDAEDKRKARTRKWRNRFFLAGVITIIVVIVVLTGNDENTGKDRGKGEIINEDNTSLLPGDDSNDPNNNVDPNVSAGGSDQADSRKFSYYACLVILFLSGINVLWWFVRRMFKLRKQRKQAEENVEAKGEELTPEEVEQGVREEMERLDRETQMKEQQEFERATESSRQVQRVRFRPVLEDITTARNKAGKRRPRLPPRRPRAP